jgi:acetate kinase
MPQILVLNAGSSSLKFAVYSVSSEENLSLALSGSVSGLPDEPQFVARGPDGRVATETDWPRADGGLARTLPRLLTWLAKTGGLDAPLAVGHRIVHGGLTFQGPVRLDEAALARLSDLIPLAPLHQPFNLEAVEAARSAFPDAAQIGLFDTAFHADQPRLARIYALPREFTDDGVIAYGFHGLSYDFIAGELRRLYGEERGGRVVVAHLGSGVSLCAMDQGRSIATTMGFSALDGPPMSTRSGGIDPGVLLYLMETKGMAAPDLTDLLYRRSGLLGVSGESGDVRHLQASVNPAAREALDLFVYRIAREIGSLAAALGGLDRLVFTAGVGENDPRIRAEILKACKWLGVDLNADANGRGDTRLTTDDSAVEALVLPTDEQIVIARGALSVLRAPDD